MQTFAPGRDIPITFQVRTVAPLPDNAILRWRALDELDQVVVSWTPVQPQADTDRMAVRIILAAENAALVPPATRALRQIELEITADDGEQSQFGEMIAIQGSTALLVGVNSVQTYGQAVLLLGDFFGDAVEGFEQVEDRGHRESAMIEAWGRICRLPFVIEFAYDDQTRVRSIDNVPPRLRDLSAQQIAQLETRMLKALRTAQVLEASEILRDDPLRKARAAGLVSQTTGESSQFFGSSKALDLGICPAAAKVLARWLRYQPRIGRA